MSRPTPGFYDMVMDEAQMNEHNQRPFVEGFAVINDGGEHDGKRLKVKAMWLHTDGCAAVTVKQLKIAGWTGEYEPMRFDGRTFRGKVEEQTDLDGKVAVDNAGNPYVWVTGFWDKGSGGGGLREASIDPGRKAQMGERMKAMLQSMSAQEQAAPPPAQPAQGGGGGWTPPSSPANPTPFSPPPTVPQRLGFCSLCGGANVLTADGAKRCSNQNCDNAIPF